MNILHIIPNLKKGGAERLVIDIVRGFVQNNTNQIKLIVFENKIEYDVSDITSHIEIVPASVSLSILKKNRLAISALQNAIEKYQPDIIHTHLFEAEVVSRSCYYPKARWFTHAHDRMQSFKKINVFKIKSKRELTNYFEKKYLLERYQQNGGNHFIAISKDIETFLTGVLPGNHRSVFLLPNAVAISRFSKSNTSVEQKPNTLCKLISIGRLDKNKNHQFLIDCILNLKAMGVPVHLTILGEGNQRTHLEAKIDQLGLSEHVSLPGAVDAIEHYLWASDLYVHSSLTEGFGLTLIEAMAAGLPVVTIDGGGNKHLVINGHNGFIVNHNEREQFVKHIIELFTNNELRQEIGKNAQLFASHYDINNYIEQLSTIYKSVN
jgi:glycosyltransferase involved in cell wall biosynthesis